MADDKGMERPIMSDQDSPHIYHNGNKIKRCLQTYSCCSLWYFRVWFLIIITSFFLLCCPISNFQSGYRDSNPEYHVRSVVPSPFGYILWQGQADLNWSAILTPEGIEPIICSLRGSRHSHSTKAPYDPRENRTLVSGVKGRRLIRLTMGPKCR